MQILENMFVKYSCHSECHETVWDVKVYLRPLLTSALHGTAHVTLPLWIFWPWNQFGLCGENLKFFVPVGSRTSTPRFFSP